MEKKWFGVVFVLTAVYLGVMFSTTGNLYAELQVGHSRVNEGVCNDLTAQGVTPELFDLCVAYCEAIDCPDTDLASGSQAGKCKQASPRILERYNNIKKDTDPPMPCVKTQTSGCPCWTPKELASVGRTYSPHVVYYTKDLHDSAKSYELDEWEDIYYWLDGSGHLLAAAVTFNGGESTCSYFDREYSNGAWSGIAREQYVTPEQGRECLSQLVSHAATINVELKCNVSPCLAP